jgi:GNAT superfamily N-acetyltransferase
LFADRAFAHALERSVVRDIRLYLEAAARLDPALDCATLDVAGGTAFYLAPASPINVWYGAGLDGSVSAEEIGRVERFYAERGATAAVSFSPLADPAFATALNVRGWVVASFENVLALDLAERPPVHPDTGSGGTGVASAPAASRVTVRIAETPDERAIWARLSPEAFTAPEPPDTEMARLGAVMASREDSVLLIGSVDGHDAGTGALWVDGDLGWLLADATLPQYRGCGVQSALHAERVGLARDRGCRFAVTEASPGTTSQRNMERAGFRVVYTRVDFVSPAPIIARGSGEGTDTPGGCVG